MSATVLLGVAHQTLASELRAVVGEAGDYAITGAEATSSAVLTALERNPSDVVLLHEDLGPLPVLDLVRDVVQRHPTVAVVLLVREGTSAILSSAMEAGARGLLSLPLSLEETTARLSSAVQLSRSLQRALSGEVDAGQAGGQLVVLAGAKGGVGTTTLAVHLALLAAAGGGRRVCLVDLDLQGGDVAALFDVTSERGVVDLADAADDLSPRAIADSCFVHPTGLRLLLAPAEGERGEELNRRAARAVLAALRSRFDIVVVDAGTVVTAANAEAVNLADTALVVVTPDVLSLRAARRLTKLWSRLQVRKDTDVTLVVNMARRDASFQPETARRFSGTPVAQSVVPSAVRELEDPTNAGDPALLVAGQFSRGLGALAAELDLVVGGGSGSNRRDSRGRTSGTRAARRRRDPDAAEVAAAVPEGRRRRRGGDDGQVAAELIPAMFVLALVALAALQGVAYGYGLVLAGHAAERGARELAVGRPVSAACSTVPGGFGCDVDATADDRVRAVLTVPRLFPLGDRLTVDADAGTVVE